MIELLAAFVHPITLAVILCGAVVVDAWLVDRRFARWWRDDVQDDTPPPERP